VRLVVCAPKRNCSCSFAEAIESCGSGNDSDLRKLLRFYNAREVGRVFCGIFSVDTPLLRTDGDGIAEKIEV
jgi:hypothetical protein